MFGVFLGIGEERLCQFVVFAGIPRASGCPGNGIDIGASVLYLAVGLGRGSENTESAEIEIEEVGRRVDGTECPVNLEVVAGKGLDEPAGENDLEDITPQAVGNPLADIGFVLFVGQRAVYASRQREVVRSEVPVTYERLYFVQVIVFAFGQ